MVLYSELKDFKAYSKLGKEHGKVDGLILDLSSWDIKNVIISPGAIKKNMVFKLNDLEEVNESEKKFVIPSDAEVEELPETSTLNTALADDELIGKAVVSKDNQDVGKVYDFDIPIQLQNWKVWKILIKRGLKERRLRIGPEEIESLTDKVVLKKSLSEIENDDENETK